MSDQTGSWQPDPFGRHQYRYWDGSNWSDQVSNDGEVAVDPPQADLADEGAGAEPTAAPAPPETSSGAAEPPPTEGVPATGWGAPAAPPAWGDQPAPDPTTSMVTAGGAGGGSAAVGSTPTSSGEPPKRSSGNKPAFIIGGILLLLVIGAGAYLLLSGDDDASRAELIAAFQDEGDLDEETATCVVDALDDEIGLDRLTEIAEDSDTATKAEELALTGAVIGCFGGDALGDNTGGDDTTDGADTTETTDDDDTTPTTERASDGVGGIPEIGPGETDEIVDMFIQMFGFTEEQATCFTDELIGGDNPAFNGMLEGSDEIDAGMMTAMFDVFAECDIPLESLMGGGIPGATPGSSSDGQSYGDDPTLDAMWDACEGGDGEACDDLYFQSALGSEYEEFGDTCGGRFERGDVLCSTEDLG